MPLANTPSFGFGAVLSAITQRQLLQRIAQRKAFGMATL